jgi:L-amino acid N-acyltransferase YncA
MRPTVLDRADNSGRPPGRHDGSAAGYPQLRSYPQAEIVAALLRGFRGVASGWKAAGMEANSGFVRPASAADAHACIAIYRRYVEDTAITFETSVPTSSEMAMRITASRDTHEWLVLERPEHYDGVIGYAYAHTFNSRAAYQWSAETSIYLAKDHRRTGGGRQLYGQLLRRLTERGYRQALASITQPNPASNAFHQSFGFQQAGLLRRVGWKNGSWHDVALMQLDLAGAEHNDPPSTIS